MVSSRWVECRAVDMAVDMRRDCFRVDGGVDDFRNNMLNRLLNVFYLFKRKKDT